MNKPITHSSQPVQILPDLFDRHAGQLPRAVALRLGAETRTYGQLKQLVDRLCAGMAAHGLPREEPTGLYMDIAFDMVAAYLAILQYGGIVVPIDPESPQQRLRTILQDSGLKYVLTQSHYMDRLLREQLRPIPVDGDIPAGCATPVPEQRPDAGAPALIIYTSGSTGRPKGVVLSHANLFHYAQSLQQLFDVQASDVYLLRGNIALIVAARQLLMPLACGASVVIASAEDRADPLELLALVRQTGVTIFDHVPSYWKGLRLLLDRLPSAEAKALFDSQARIVAAGGERVDKQVAQLWFERFRPGTEFYNIYGQTEGTGVVAAHRIDPADLEHHAAIPVGKAVRGMQMLVLDQDQRPVPPARKGEICIAGAGVALGYWQQPALTARHFLNWSGLAATPGADILYKTGDYGLLREDGEIEFLGRMDNQVNIRGYRVELSEIESALSCHPQIATAAVVVRTDDAGEPEILGYFTATDGIDIPALRQQLSQQLPHYMLPSRLIALDTLPLTSSGKVDHGQLRLQEHAAIGSLQRRIDRPVNELQRQLVKIWQDVLCTDQVGISDNFFDLGGTSLKAVSLVTAIETELGLTVPLAKLRKLSTIAALTEDIAGWPDTAPGPVSAHLRDEDYKRMLSIMAGTRIAQFKPGSLVLQLNASGSEPPFFWCFNAPQQEMSALAARLPRNQPMYGMLSSVPLRNDQTTLEQVAAHYVDELLEILPNGPFWLGGNCRGAKVVCEMVRLFEQRDTPVEKICLLEFFHPRLNAYEGELCLAFGRHSDLKRHEPLSLERTDWARPFVKEPEINWIECGHGVFFDDENIQSLADIVQRWLHR